MQRVLFDDNVSSCYPMHPEIRLKNLPFFKVEATLMKPTPLLSVHFVEGYAINKFMLILEAQQATDIALHR